MAALVEEEDLPQAKADELFVAAHKEAETSGAAEAEPPAPTTYKASRRSSLNVRFFCFPI